MLVEAKILSANLAPHMKDGQKVGDKCEIALQLSNPTQVELCTLWSSQVSREEHKHFMANVGKDVRLALRVEVFNGKIQFSINTQVIPVLVNQPKAA